LVGLVLFGWAAERNPLPTYAQSDDDKSSIQSQIDAHNKQIEDLQKEISQYQQQLNTLGAQHQTLQSAIKTIDVSRQQTSTQIKVTQNKMDASQLRLEQLSGQITQKEYQIQLDRKSVAQSLRELAISDGDTMIERVLAAGSMADAWASADTALAVSDALRTNAAELAGVTAELGSQKADESSTRDKLAKLNSELASQKHSLDVNKAEKDKLLTQTKSQESSYQSLIAQKKAQQKVFENELNNLQKQLESVSQSSIPVVQTGALAWPYSPTFATHCQSLSGALGNVHCITQYFGNTPFATANSSIYNGMGHDGIDIGMPVGTPVQSALAGTVLGTGNTDAYHSPVTGAQCYSFGKWVMVKHANGLATLYAHLSQISVSSGQSVATGEVVGYSGMTGYATGPHLHFGVYASAGVQIMDLGKFRGSGGTPCTDGGAVLPVAPTNAYLNPLSYL
jgi:murein DD-endopeptidase MepM/ murein hydrolase activator NlpD